MNLGATTSVTAEGKIRKLTPAQLRTFYNLFFMFLTGIAFRKKYGCSQNELWLMNNI